MIEGHTEWVMEYRTKRDTNNQWTAWAPLPVNLTFTLGHFPPHTTLSDNFKFNTAPLAP